MDYQGENFLIRHFGKACSDILLFRFRLALLTGSILSFFAFYTLLLFRSS